MSARDGRARHASDRVPVRSDVSGTDAQDDSDRGRKPVDHPLGGPADHRTNGDDDQSRSSPANGIDEGADETVIKFLRSRLRAGSAEHRILLSPDLAGDFPLLSDRLRGLLGAAQRHYRPLTGQAGMRQKYPRGDVRQRFVSRSRPVPHHALIQEQTRPALANDSTAAHRHPSRAPGP
jgi:hypothetical protein